MRHQTRKFEYSFFKRGFQALWELLDGHKKRSLEFFLWSVVCTSLSIVPVVIAKEVFNLVKEGSFVVDYEVVKLILLMLFIVVFNEFLKKICMDIRFLEFRENLAFSWPQTAFENLLNLPLSFHLRENTGKKVSKINKGCNNTVSVLNNIYNALPNILFLVFNSGVVFYMDWRLGILFFLPLLIASWILWRSYQVSAKVWQEVEIHKEKANGIFCESIICINTVKSSSQEKEESQRFSEVLAQKKEATIKANKIVYWHSFFASVVIYGFYIITFGASYYLSVHGLATVGVMAYIFTTTKTMYKGLWILIGSFQGILINLISVIRMKDLVDEKDTIKYSKDMVIPKELKDEVNHYYDNFDHNKHSVKVDLYRKMKNLVLSLIRLRDLKNEKKEIEYYKRPVLMNEIKGDISYSDVSFGYTDRGQKIFSNFDLKIPSGSILAIVGSTGIGKTSFINLLLHLYDVDKGKISIDDVNINDFVPIFRKLFAIVPQNIDIFNNDILHNVRYGCREATEEDVKKALIISKFPEAIDSNNFPEGIYTMIGEGGKDISGGQKQRIAIARACLRLMVGKAKFLVLDEATSNLDADTERDIREVINGLKKEMDFTTIVITHRLSMVKYADEIIFLDRGKIAERGTHESLIKEGGRYAGFVENQKLSKDEIN